MKKLLFYFAVLISSEIDLQAALSVQDQTTKESKFTKLFQKVLQGDLSALSEIKVEAKNVLPWSKKEKRKVLKELETVLDKAVELKYKKLEAEQAKINVRKEELEHEGEKGFFKKWFGDSMSSEQMEQQLQELDIKSSDLSKETEKAVSDFSILSRQIVDELAPMLDGKHQGLLSSYDRQPYHDRISLIDVRDFDLDHIPNDQEVDAYVRTQIDSLAKQGKVSVPQHKLSKDSFYRKAVDRVVDLYSNDKNIDDLHPKIRKHIDVYTSDLARKAYEVRYPDAGVPIESEVTQAHGKIQGVSNPKLRDMVHEKILEIHIEQKQAQERKIIQEKARVEDIASVRDF